MTLLSQHPCLTNDSHEENTLSWHRIPVLSDNYIWIIRDHQHGITLAVDPATASEPREFLEQQGWSLDVILNTHHHYDHVGGNLELKKRYGAKIYGAKKDKSRIPGITHFLEDGDQLKIGSFHFDIREVDGHTMGHIMYFECHRHWLFCGDTLFSLGCGRLFEGTPDMLHMSMSKIKDYPDNTYVFCAHEYTLSNTRFTMTLDLENQDLIQFYQAILKLRTSQLPTIPSLLGIEKKLNPFLRAQDSTFTQLPHVPQFTKPSLLLAWLRKEKDRFS
ncbi:MAG: hydroxyacylglutathione hydrolase [Proteobacteria bacterium]|nr:hydroxyacylglutathione hydrolase [Pseudomonadota bacterium]